MTSEVHPIKSDPQAPHTPAQPDTADNDSTGQLVSHQRVPGLSRPAPPDIADQVDTFMAKVPACTLCLGTPHDRAKLALWLVAFADQLAAGGTGDDRP